MPRRSSPYGVRPYELCLFRLPDWTEFMSYLYLPVYMQDTRAKDIRLPERLEFTRELVTMAHRNGDLCGGPYKYTYLTVKRGFATPDNPLNRPGWHTDGFGTDDLNYVWVNRFPTDYAIQDFHGISVDDSISMQQFEAQVYPDKIVHYEPNLLLRLNPYVVHATPKIPAPGGERAFIKVSLSNHKYNLQGNSHNFLFDYDWKMHPRNTVRNNPIGPSSNGDFIEDEDE